MEKDEETYAMVGCDMKVHNTQDPVLISVAKVLPMARPEVIYPQCLAIEPENKDLKFKRKQDHPIFYERLDFSTRRADFVVEDKVLIEIKSLVKLEDVHIARANNYTLANDFPKGFLINFGGQSLKYKLMFNPKYQLKPNPENSKIL